MNKFILIIVGLLITAISFFFGVQYEKQNKNIISFSVNPQKIDVSKLPQKAIVKRVIDGDTIELDNGMILRYVGITAPEEGELFYEEAKEENKRFVEGKEIKIEYDNYKADKFERILGYAFIDNKNISVELARKGLAEVVIYQKRKPFIYQQQLLDAEKEAKNKKLGIWSLPK